MVARGVSPRRLKAVRRVYEEMLASGLTPQEFARRAVEKAEEAVHQNNIAWWRPVLVGLMAATTIESLWSLAFGSGSWASLFVSAGMFAALVSGFDDDDLPPRRRLILGPVIGASGFGLVLLAIRLAFGSW
jgi:hypothetical protein